MKNKILNLFLFLLLFSQSPSYSIEDTTFIDNSYSYEELEYEQDNNEGDESDEDFFFEDNPHSPYFLKKKKKKFLTVFTVFQQEARFLKEWIEYHKLLGADHFLLYNNASQDNFKEVLKPYIKSGLVTLKNWGDPNGDWQSGSNWNQIGAIRQAVHIMKKKTKWMAIIDVDEFIVPRDGTSLKPILKKYDKYAALYMYWVFFGTSFVERIPDNKLLIETLTMRMNWPPKRATLTKCLVKPKHVQYANVHGSSVKSPHKRYSFGYGKKPEVVLHHYSVRDIDFLTNVKKERRERYEGAPWAEEALQKKIKAFNDVEDLVMLKFVEKLKKQVFQK